jgi:hypothetical protein
MNTTIEEAPTFTETELFANDGKNGAVGVYRTMYGSAVADQTISVVIEYDNVHEAGTNLTIEEAARLHAALGRLIAQAGV